MRDYKSVCPSCGGEVPTGSIWIYLMKFYCTQQCVQKAVRGPKR